jgi:hypothetical protein
MRVDLSKSKTFQGDMADERVRLHDAAVIWNKQQSHDITVAPNAARGAQRAAPAPMAKSTTTFQRGGIVAYSDAADLEVERMMKAADGGFSVPISQVGIAGSPMLKSQGCPHCGGHFSAMVTRCTNCGFDTQTMSKAAPQGHPLPLRLQRVKPEADLYIPRKR